MKKLSVWMLRAAERFYLHAHEWHNLDNDEYHPPEGYPFKIKVPRYNRRHAVNAQHQVNAGNRATNRTAVARFSEIVGGEDLEGLLRNSLESGKPGTSLDG
jgi:hypothetical protein